MMLTLKIFWHFRKARDDVFSEVYADLDLETREDAQDNPIKVHVLVGTYYTLPRNPPPPPHIPVVVSTIQVDHFFTFVPCFHIFLQIIHKIFLGDINFEDSLLQDTRRYKKKHRVKGQDEPDMFKASTYAEKAINIFRNKVNKKFIFE